MTRQTRPTSRIRRTGGVLIGLAILTAGPLLLAPPASAAVRSAGTGQVTFGVQPATSGRPDARPNLSYGVTPGSTVRDQVAIVNFSTTPLTLSVYATDAVNTAGGGFSLLAGGQKPKDAGAWASVAGRPAGASTTVTVPARVTTGPGFVVLPVVLHVPAGAAPGDHVGGVVAVLSTTGTNSQGARVRLEQRVATRLFVRVSGTARPQLALDHLSTTYRAGAAGLGAGTVTVTYTVHNTGNVSLGARQSVLIDGLFGTAGSAARTADIPLLLPGASVRERIDVPGVLPLLRLSATVTLRPTHPAGAVDPGLADEVVATVSFWAIPWALVLLVLAAVGGGVWWQRRHRGPRAASGRAAPPAPSARVSAGVPS